MMSARSQVWGLQPQMPLFKHERKLNLLCLRLWIRTVLEFHNCFVDEDITAYENLANIEVHSKKKTTSTSNHAVNSSSVFSPLLSQPSLFQRSVCTSYIAAWFLLLQQSNSVSMHSFLLLFQKEASTSSCCQSELMSSDSQVLDKLSDSDELDSLNPSASAVGSLNPSAQQLHHTTTLQLLSCWWVWCTCFICVCCNFYWWHCQINHI
jgi:hypothetical protein